MVSVSEAKAIIATHIQPLMPIIIGLTEAAGHILTQDIHAQFDIPAFEQSGVDGYAIRYADKELKLRIVGEIAAGSTREIGITPGQAVRIFTGAPLPHGADTVVMQEKICIEEGNLLIKDTQLLPGDNVRHQGAEIKASSLAMEKNTCLTPAAIGFLAGIGISQVSIYPMPSVSIIITGNEFQQPGNELKPGQVYESNSFSLRAALIQAGVNQIKIIYAPDTLHLLQKTLAEALSSSDMVLLSGGVSVGDYDFVVEAATHCGVTQQFHKVKQRPGKPLYFGTKGDKPVFGLPGNPASVLSCFYNYVLPTIYLLSHSKKNIVYEEALLSSAYRKPQGLTHFLKGFYNEGTVKLLGAQESFRLSSFAQANCLICLEEEREEYEAGEKVIIYLLPY